MNGRQDWLRLLAVAALVGAPLAGARENPRAAEIVTETQGGTAPAQAGGGERRPYREGEGVRVVGAPLAGARENPRAAGIVTEAQGGSASAHAGGGERRPYGELACAPATLADPRWRQSDERTEVLEGGAERRAPRPGVSLKQARVEAVPEAGLRMFAEGPEAMLEATPRALGWPANWRGFSTLVAVVESHAEPVLFEVTVLAGRGRLIERRALSPRSTTEVRLPLADLALAAGAGPLYEVAGLRLGLVGEPDTAAPSATVRALRLEPRDGEPPAVVDRFGQRASGWWTGRILSDDELRARRDFEGVRLAARPALAARDRFGGWTDGPRFAPSGFFRVERDAGGRWWFVTPEGYPFWSLGATGVRVGNVMDTARAAGREFLFEALPRPSDEAWFAGVYPVTTGSVTLAGNVHFYRWNVLRKYDAVEAWRDRVLMRWERWGLNTLGAWSDEVMLVQRRIPHTRFLRARAEVPGVASVHGFPDIWDPRWEAWVDAEFARDTAAERDNPWLLGYFVDNEASWRNMRLLDLPLESRLREAWMEFMRGRYPDIAACNAAWGASFAGWDEVRALRNEQVPAAGPGREDMAAFEAAYAERYASTVRRLLRKNDPDHLYLGCRFVRVPPAAGIVAAVGRHADLLSVNCYARVPDPQAFRAWHEMSGGRPILIGEFHFPLESGRQLPPPYQAFGEAEREAMVVDFVRTWAGQPWSLGCHWYQHADQPTTGRHSDGENQTVGLVSIVDEPYEHLVRAFRNASEQAAAWHLNAAP